MLIRDSIFVWMVRLDAEPIAPELLASCHAVLSAEERARADRFRREELRRDYMVCHAALRLVLGDCVGVAPAEVRFADAPSDAAGAKPALFRKIGSGGELADVRFNLSHTKGVALIGVALGREIGVDIEWQRPMDDLEAMARSVMSDEELARWREIDASGRMRAFYHLWTRKESYLKAIGLGLYRSLQDVSVPVSAERLEAGVNGGEGNRVRDRSGRGVWSVADLTVPEGYSASVCCEGEQVLPVVFADLDLNRLIQDSERE